VIGLLNNDQAFYIARNMRAADRREVLATCWHDDVDQFAKEALALGGPAYCVEKDDGTPVAMGGLTTPQPMVWNAWMVATDDIGCVGVQLTRHCLYLIKYMFQDRQAHRIQAASAAFHADAHNWLERLGFKYEAGMNGYGKAGETFLLYSMTEEPDGHVLHRQQ